MHRRAAGLTPLGRFFHLFASAAPGPRLASSRPRWPGARQFNSAAQPGMIILELELAAMQAGNGGGKAQPEPRTGLGTALLKTHEPLHHAAAIGLRNTGSAIRDRQRDVLALTAGLDHD